MNTESNANEHGPDGEHRGDSEHRPDSEQSHGLAPETTSGLTQPSAETTPPSSADLTPPAATAPTAPLQPTEQHSTEQAAAPARLGPRTGTIVWGVLVLAFCAIVLQRTVAPEMFDPVSWIITVVLGTGVLLLVVAVAVILRSRR